MILQLISFLLLLQTTEVPFRAKDDFQVELKYNFKERPPRDANTVHFDEKSVSERRPNGPLPYLIVNVKILHATTEEMRYKCENNLSQTLFNRKADKTLSYDIDMGYIDDIKDRITAYNFTVYALTGKREMINRIELVVMEDGTFLVNGEKRGKF